MSGCGRLPLWIPESDGRPTANMLNEHARLSSRAASGYPFSYQHSQTPDADSGTRRRKNGCI